MSSRPYKIEVVVSKRIEIRDESRVLLVVFARLVAAAHDRAPCFYTSLSVVVKILRYLDERNCSSYTLILGIISIETCRLSFLNFFKHLLAYMFIIFGFLHLSRESAFSLILCVTDRAVI